VTTELEWAYLAGLIDGDGHVRAKLMQAPDGRLRRDIVICIAQGNMHLEVIEWLCEHIDGGRVYSQGDNATQWRVNKLRDFDLILSRILPYVVLKKPEVESALIMVEGRREFLRRRALGETFNGG